MPKQNEIEIPLLKCLVEDGGYAFSKDIYCRITKFFPMLTDSDLMQTLPSGSYELHNRVYRAIQKLTSRGEMKSLGRRLWAITAEGRKRLAAWNEFEQKLQELPPAQFERLAGALLYAYGFFEVKVTWRTGDGGIDGHGKLRVGFATKNAAFRCRRGKGLVSEEEIDEFCGAIQGEFEEGIFFTTSDFSTLARLASIREDAAPIVCLNGDGMLQLMAVEPYEDILDRALSGRPS